MTNVVPFFPTGDFDVDFGINNEVNFTVLENQFGDGYIQRAADGINSNRDTWNAAWTNLTNSESALIFGFLRERAGYKPFYYQAPGEDVAKQWTARDVKRQPTGVSDKLAYWKISATLKQEFGATIEVKYVQMVSGVLATGNAGVVTGNAPSKGLVGTFATGFVGIITPNNATIIGVSATGSAGIIIGAGTRLNGVGATGICGRITPTAGLGLNPTLTGTSATGTAEVIGVLIV